MSTREIADRAGVSETLIFKNFSTKTGLFRAAIVQPFVDAIEAEIDRPRPDRRTLASDPAETRAFVGSMYDVFREHRALAAMLFAGDEMIDSEIRDAGMVDEVRDVMDRFVAHAGVEADAVGRSIAPAAHDLAIRGHMAMIAGVATNSTWLFGSRRPGRQTIVDELSEWVLLRYGGAARQDAEDPQ